MIRRSHGRVPGQPPPSGDRPIASTSSSIRPRYKDRVNADRVPSTRPKGQGRRGRRGSTPGLKDTKTRRGRRGSTPGLKDARTTKGTTGFNTKARRHEDHGG